MFIISVQIIEKSGTRYFYILFLNITDDANNLFQLPFMDVLRQELQFIFKCKGSTKPVRKKASEAGNDEDQDDEDEAIYGGSDVYSYGTKHPIT